MAFFEFPNYILGNYGKIYQLVYPGVLIAFAIAAIFAFFLGIIMALSLRTNQIFNLTLNAIRQIPPLAWIPLLILWFGIGEVTKIILIIKSAFFPYITKYHQWNTNDTYDLY
ncbi:hypothetical protein [Providencia hangzhouensis]|uniref:hypothetical protein n=1 Tax=Providencia hangzhouensis TaxID=3031799 RepID=UPI0034DD1E44